jgi:DNA-binding MarR family transcriptional regulator
MASSMPIGFWLKLVDQLIDRQFSAALDEHGVTRRQWQLLNVLSQGDATMEQLDAAVAPFLNPDADETSAEHLAELVDSAWVAKTGARYILTEQGSAAFARLAAVVARNRDKAAEGVADDDYRTTIAVLEQMARNLGWNE